MRIRYLTLPNGRVPVVEWLESLPSKTRAIILQYVERIGQGGGKKNIRSLGDEIFEIKVNFGPGYRVYFGKEGKDIILLLIGGDKSTQRKDIVKAKKYWREYHV